MGKNLARLIAVLMSASFLLSACGDTATPSPTNASTTTAATTTSASSTTPAASTVTTGATVATTSVPTTSSTALRDPKTVALEAAGGKPLGGTINFLGVLGGDEQAKFLGMLKPFEEATGVKIQYESTRDLSAVLQTRLDGGNPPDVVSNPSMGEMISYAKKGKLVDLSQFLDMTTLKQQYDPSLLNTATVNGKLYSFFQAVNLEGLMWYNPKQYKGPNPPASWAELQTWTESQAAAGQKPWCFGLESGAASGWPGAIWITELLLRQAGPEKYDQLVQGKLAWTSPEVKTAFQTFGKIATDPKMVNGGATAVLSINFANSGDGMYTQPPGCSLVMQSSFMGDIIKGNHPTLKPTEDINFYAFPDIKPEYAGLRQISGEGVGLLKDTPQGRALIKYMASAEASALLAKAGGWLTPNKLVPSDVYPSEFNKQAAKVLAKASGVYYDAGAIIPAAMDQALWKGLLSYLQSPDQLDSILAGLDTVQKDAYK